MNKTVKLTAQFVVGFENGHHVVIDHGEVVYRDDTILYVGKHYDGTVDETISLGKSVISPGFIDLDSDIDSDHALVDVAVPKNSQDAFAAADTKREKDPYTDHDFYIRQKFSMAQLIKNGITTFMAIEGERFHKFAQSYHEIEIMAHAAKEMGLRSYLAPSFKSTLVRETPWDETQSEPSFQDALKFYKDFHNTNNGLIQSYVNPCQLTITKLDILQRACQFAKENHAPMRLHACEGVHEWAYTQKYFGMTTIDWLESQGLLCENLLIPHCVTAKDSEILKLGHYGVSVIHTPFAEANVGSALYSFGKYQSMGVNMTMGTDAQPNDMIRNLRFAWDLDRFQSRHRYFLEYHEDGSYTDLYQNEPRYPLTDADDYFNAATINGAKALGREDIGKLCVGAKADIIAIDLDSIRVGPHHDPLRTLIMSCTGADVTHTIVNGVMLMRDKKIIGVDEKALLCDAQTVYDRFIELYHEFDVLKRPTTVFFPPIFPKL